MTPILDLIRELYPLHRSIVSDGMDEALALVGRRFPGPYVIERYQAGGSAWTWPIPGRYVVREAVLSVEQPGAGRWTTVCDVRAHPLHLVDYSQPVDAVLPWDDLAPHLHTAPHRPDALPWMFTYYTPAWGFCVTQRQHDALPRDRRYHALIDSEIRMGPNDGLAVGIGEVAGPNPSSGQVFICTNLCHVAQANDSLSGAAVAVRLAERLAEDPLPLGSHGVRFLFCPETIGSVCYLAHHPEVITQSVAGLCCEMLGTDGPLVLQRSRGGWDDRITRIAEAVLGEMGPRWDPTNLDTLGGWGSVPFRDPGTARNDELVLNGPGVNIPTVALTRFPYPQYHTSDDTPDILSEDKLEEAARVIERIVRIAATDYMPRRAFTGPLFLTGVGMWIDWRTDPQGNAAMDEFMLRLEGEESAFDISRALKMPFERVRGWVETLWAKGLVQRA